MKYLENALTRDISFDSSVFELWDVMEESLTYMHDHDGDIINPESELSSNFMQLWELSYGLAATLKSDIEETKTVQTAIYRGMCFALQVVEDIKSSPIGVIDLSSIIPDDNSAAEDEILMQTSKYLSERSNIVSFLGRFMPEIDYTYTHNQYVETGAALMFMLSERQQASEILTEEVINLTPEMFTDSSEAKRY